MEGLRQERLSRHTYTKYGAITCDQYALAHKEILFPLIQHSLEKALNRLAIHITGMCLCIAASTIFCNNLRNHTQGLQQRQALCAALPKPNSSPPNERSDYSLGSIVPRLGGVSAPPARRHLPTRATIVLRLSYRPYILWMTPPFPTHRTPPFPFSGVDSL